jgi:ribose transport system permease protein
MGERTRGTNSASRTAAVLVEYLGLAGVLGLLILFFGVTTDHFLTATTFQTLANQMPAALLIAVGMTFVLLTGGIDLSVGSVLALSGAVLGVVLVHGHWPLWAAIPLALLVGAGVGLFNGVVSTRWPLPSFIVTLGALEAARGAAYLVAGSQTQYIGASIEALAATSPLGISWPFLLSLLLVLIAQVTLTRTVFGRRVFAVGANEEAARLSGIPTRRIRCAVFVLSGLLSGLAAVIHCARLGAADPNAGIGYELHAIAAVVIGGTSLLGGRGSVIKTLFGVLIIAVLETGLAHAGAGEPAKRLVTGAVIIAAVILDYFRGTLRRKA